jgi:hypothetical protein
MFELSDPRTWQLITNLLLVAVALVAAIYIGVGLYKRSYARSTNPFRPHPELDTHTMILPDLGITMADGGDKIEDKKS